MGVKCQVCNNEFKEEFTDVWSSTLGAASFRYCKLCRTVSAEPDGMQQELGHEYLTFRAGKYHPVSEYYEYINRFIDSLEESVIPEDESQGFKELLMEYKKNRISRCLFNPDLKSENCRECEHFINHETENSLGISESDREVAWCKKYNMSVGD
jgi:hypothetical protein